MKKRNGFYLIGGIEFKSIKSISIYYGIDLKLFNKKIFNGETIESILGLSGYIEEDFNEDDIKYILDNLGIYKTTKYNRGIFSTEQRRKIMRLYYNELDAWNIAMQTGFNYKDVNDYINNRENKLIIDGQKICTSCLKSKTLDKFWKTKTGVRSECAECINKFRRDKYKKDPLYKKKINQQCINSYYKNSKEKIIKRSEMTEEQKEELRAKDRIRGQRFRDKKLKNLINIKRILNDKL